MTHPRRDVGPLLRALDGPPDAVVVDEQSAGVWPTARRAWLSAPSSADVVLVLQDDVEPCRDLLATARRIAEALPGEIVSLYSPACKFASAADADGCRWYVRSAAMWGQAMMMPRELALQWISWCDVHTTDVGVDDERLALWTALSRIRTYYPLPSLVEHAGVDRSLIGFAGSAARRAQRFIGANVSGLSLDWSASEFPPLQRTGSPAVYARVLRPESPYYHLASA
jgi:hypothetical protein